jgi:hypothetical protein
MKKALILAAILASAVGAIVQTNVLEASLAGNSTVLLTVYGTPGVSCDLLSTTNLLDQSSWSSMESLSLTDAPQVINPGVATNQMQVFKTVQPQTGVYSVNVAGYVNVTLYPGLMGTN